MPMLVRDHYVEEQIKAERAINGADRHDEVWDGVYVVAPLPNDESQDLVDGLGFVFHTIVRLPKLGRVRPGVNVSDRDRGWMHNYRAPDVVVYLNGTKAINRGSHWVGGPDFAVEILSPDDAAREKLDFYAIVGTREVLIVDRDPWDLELYRLNSGTLPMVGRIAVGDGNSLVSEVLPLSIRLIPGDERPVVEARHSDGVQHWSI